MAKINALEISFKLITSHFIIDFKVVVLAFKFDPSSFTYAIFFPNPY